MKVQLSIDDSLMQKVDDYTKKVYMTRSSFFAQIASQHLMQVEVVTAIKKLQIAMDTIAKKGELSEESKQELREFERLANMLTGQI